MQKIVFIGGTNLRLVKGIDRFSEDLDFDCKDLSKEEFLKMTDGVVRFLERSGYRIETRDKENPRLTAYRRTICFPELLFDLGFSGYREERFLIKLESQDQGVIYEPVIANIKGRDFYDLMFLFAQTKPDYDFLSRRCRIILQQ